MKALRALAVILPLAVIAGCASAHGRRAGPGSEGGEPRSTAPEDPSPLSYRFHEPVCSGDGWCWVNPRPHGRALAAIRVSTPTDVWVAGSNGTIQHWDGTDWMMTPVPVDLPAEVRLSFYDLWGLGPTDLWAVGDTQPTDYGAYLLHWNGWSWSNSTQPLPEYQSLPQLRDGPVRAALPAAAPTDAPLTGLWRQGEQEVWVTGQNGTLLHWDGQRWSDVPTGTEEQLVDVSGSDPRNVWAVGDEGSILRWDGTKVSRLAPEGWRRDLVDVSGSGPDDVWALGASEEILHWDGRRWTSTAGPAEVGLARIVSTGRGQAWVVGADGTILRWSGRSWTRVESPTTESLYAIWATSPDDIWAVGWNGAIIHWDGQRWSSSPSGFTASALGGDPEDIISLHDVWAAGPTEVWAVGEVWNGSTMGELVLGVILHWDGRAWSSQTIPANGGVYMRDGPFTHVWGTGPGDVWLLGAGTVGHYDGATWTAADDPPLLNACYEYRIWGGGGTTSPSVRALRVAGAEGAWAVGDGGLIVRWDGERWAVESSGADSDLHGIWGSELYGLWAVGDRGTILFKAPQE